MLWDRLFSVAAFRRTFALDALPTDTRGACPGRAICTAGLLMVTLGWSALAAQTPRRLADFDTTARPTVGTQVALPGPGAELPNGKVLFSGFDDDHGAELWIRDGVQTQRLVDIAPGPESSFPGSFVGHDGKVFFRARDPFHGYELWASDGTVAGTMRIIDLAPGQASGLSTEMVSSGSLLFFNGSDPASGGELRVLDSSGTVSVIDLVAGPGSSNPEELVADGLGGIYFLIDDEVWRSEGTALTTTRLEDSFSNALPAERLTPVGPGQVVLRQDGALTLWDETDGPTTTSFDAVLSNIVAFDGALLFVGRDLSSGKGAELYRWYGDSNPPELVADLNPNSASAFLGFPRIGLAGGQLLMHATDGTAVGREVYVLSGSEDTPTLLADLEPAGDLSLSSSGFFAHDGLGYFSACLDAGGCGVWRVDGTASQQALWRPGAVNMWIGGSTTDGLMVSSLEDDLQRIFLVDGSQAGQIGSFSTSTSFIDEIVPGRTPDEIVLNVWTSGYGEEPWRVLAAGTKELLGDVVPGPDSSRPRWLQAQAGHVAFIPSSFTTARTDAHIWDESGIQIVSLDFPDEGSATGMVPFLNDLLLFSFAPGETQRQLFRLDPVTRVSTQLTSGVAVGATAHVAGGAAFFEVDDRLWMTDGSVAGTQIVHPTLPYLFGAVRPQPPGQRGQSAPEFVFLTSEDPPRLYRTDGTEDGTALVADQLPGGGDLAAGGEISVRADGAAVFLDVSGSLYAVGPVGLTLLAEVLPFSLEGPTETGWFFRSVDPATGGEYGFTDGTVAGTRILDLYPGSEAGLTNVSFAVDGAFAYFAALTPGRGRELWRSDGTVSGTQPLPEVLPGPAGPQIGSLLAWGDRLYFGANGADGTGYELWVLDLPLFVDGFESGDVSAWQ